jgi:AcrR family transcriptional regulator
MAVTIHRPGLRERKKLRTQRAIVETATALFAKQGYAATTVAEIAEAVEVSPSTVFKYFPTKADLVFNLVDVITESLRHRIENRPEAETTAAAVVAWVVEDLPAIETPYAELLRGLPRLVASDPELQVEERLRLARFEDVLADGFAHDLGEPPESMRVRVLSAIAVRGMGDVWSAWHAKHESDQPFDLSAMFAVKAEYIGRALAAGRTAIDTLPRL